MIDRELSQAPIAANQRFQRTRSTGPRVVAQSAGGAASSESLATKGARRSSMSDVLCLLNSDQEAVTSGSIEAAR